MKKKTDNASLPSKIALRRWLLTKLQWSQVTVLDACAGAGHVWTAMEDHVTIQQWIRCDLKPRQIGTLALSATQAMRSLPLDAFNVVDIDPWGEPWEAYREFLARFRQPTAVFLTHGHVAQAVVALSNLAAIGLPTDWPVPRTPSLSAFIAGAHLSYTWRYATILHAARVAFPNVTYYALGLAPNPATGASPPEPV